MNKELLFPSTIILSEQEIDIGSMSLPEHDFVETFLGDVLLRYELCGKPRVVIGIAGPSGAGKSLLASLAASCAKDIQKSPPIHALSIDAFHFPTAYLETRRIPGGALSDVKGRADTYDTQLLATELARFHDGKDVRFPVYSRKIHDPIPGRELVAGEHALLLLEGLWLLSDAHGWGEVHDEIDFSYFLDGDPERLKRQTCERHVRGGRNEDDALHFYESSDIKNAEFVLATKMRADACIAWPKKAY